MQVELWPLANIHPYDRNPRKNDHAVEAVAKSITEYGFRQPIVVDEHGVIIVGHTRWKAAQRLGMEKAPVHVAVGLSAEKARAYRLADNKLNEMAEWDTDLLPAELKELELLDVSLADLGWTSEELTQVFAPKGNEGLTDEDEVPLPPDAATTKPGDLWILGNHRLLCGDSSKTGDLGVLLAGETIDLVNTDPPYNVKVEPRSNNAIAAGLSSFQSTSAGSQSGSQMGGAGHHQSMDLARHPEKAKPTQRKLRAKDRPLANDFVTDDAFDTMLGAWFGNLSWAMKPGAGFYIWGGYANLGNYPGPLKANGLYFSQAIVWDKQHPVLTRKDFMGAFEICFYGWKEGAAHRYLGPNNATDLWHVKKVNPQSMVHLTEKPVELAKRAIEYSSHPGERVLDLFGGSGSTLIAAEVTGRRAYLMELDALYCDVIVQRWEKFTGKKAELVRGANAGAGGDA